MLCQGLFRNFSDAFLPLLKPHMERLVADSHESKQRCVAEIISGLIRGCKHWSYSKVWIRKLTPSCFMFLELHGEVIWFYVNVPFEGAFQTLQLVFFFSLQVDNLWEVLCPLLRTALSNITIETYADWGTCIATACVSFCPFLSTVCLGF